MKLTINKCPKCDSTSFYTRTTGTAIYIQTYGIYATKQNFNTNKIETCVEPEGGEWDWNKINKKEDVRCSDCEYSMKRYVENTEK